MTDKTNRHMDGAQSKRSAFSPIQVDLVDRLSRETDTLLTRIAQSNASEEDETDGLAA